MKTLFVYPNCSKGGVTSVIRARAINQPDDHFDLVFFNDRGGLGAFADLPNVNARIVRSDRAGSYLQYISSRQDYDEIRVISSPDIANTLSSSDSDLVIYEFHSSNLKVVENEISELNLDRLAEIVVPSAEMREWLTPRLKRRIRYRLRVEENLIDTSNFHSGRSGDFLRNFPLSEDVRPIVWVGRFDSGKGVNYLPRILRQLPREYVAFVVVSLENDSNRAGAFLYECDAMGVGDRVHLLMNLSSAELGDLYRSAAIRDGWYLSTSLMESFGYAVREALECGLGVATFDLPVFKSLRSDRLVTSPVGDVLDLAQSIRSTDSR